MATALLNSITSSTLPSLKLKFFNAPSKITRDDVNKAVPLSSWTIWSSVSRCT